MSGYFEKLIQSYGPAADTPPARLPWTAEVAVPPVAVGDEAADPEPVNAAQRSQTSPKDDAAATPAKDLSVSIPEPATAQANPVVQSDPDPAITPVIERIVQTGADFAQPPPAPDLTPADVQVVHQQELHETHLHVAETHLHQHDHPADNVVAADFMPDARARPRQPDTPPPTAPEPDDLTSALAELEAHLARALSGFHSTAPQPATPVITPADFEPDGSHPPPVESETIREVTREIVREVHHHHETRTEPAPRPAPRTAEEASRIGPIRFASTWDRPGGAG